MPVKKLKKGWETEAHKRIVAGKHSRATLIKAIASQETDWTLEDILTTYLPYIDDDALNTMAVFMSDLGDE